MASCRLAAASAQHDAPVVVGLGVVGSQAQRLLQAGQGVVQPGLQEQDLTQVVVRLGPVRLETECLPVARRRLVVLAPPL